MTGAMAAPFVELYIGGQASGLTLGDTLKEFTYRDVHHGEVDEISLTLADPKGLWRGDWAIDAGTEITGVMGYRSMANGTVPCGTYAVGDDEASGDGSGDISVFHAQAAFTSKELRTKRSEAHNKTNLSGVVRKVAARHGLAVVGEIPNLSFERLTQNGETDLSFLTRLAEDYGCYFSVKGSRLVFTTRESIEKSPPARRFNLTPGDPMTSYQLRRSSHKLYSKAEMAYLHPKSKKVLRASHTDPRVQSGDVLKLDDRAETPAHADRICKARLARENDGLITGSITLVGDPLLVAGQVVELGASFGRYAGRWLVNSASHKFTASGYLTEIDIKGI